MQGPTLHREINTIGQSSASPGWPGGGGGGLHESLGSIEVRLTLAHLCNNLFHTCMIFMWVSRNLKTGLLATCQNKLYNYTSTLISDRSSQYGHLQTALHRPPPRIARPPHSPLPVPYISSITPTSQTRHPHQLLSPPPDLHSQTKYHSTSRFAPSLYPAVHM